MTRFDKSTAPSPAHSPAQHLFARLSGRREGQKLSQKLNQNLGQKLGQNVIQILADMLLPLLCPECRTPLAGAGLCGRCWSGLQAIAEPLCQCCGRALAHHLPDNLCLACHLNPPPLGRIRAGYLYNDASRQLILAFKHGDRLDLGPVIAQLLAQAFARLAEPEMLVLPIPLHRSRYFKRRYNQSAELARLLCASPAGRALRPAPGLLRRVRATRQMGGLGQAARQRNVKNAFALSRPLIAGQPILLIDDVMTTGATLHEAARCLKKARAGQVDALVFARVG